MVRITCVPSATNSSSLKEETEVTTQCPYSNLMASASCTDMCRPTARSLVKWSPPSGTTAVWATAPSKKTTSSVEAAPISSRQAPSSRSSAETVASAAAMASNTVSETSKPALLAQVITLCAALAEQVEICRFTSSRLPTIPTGSWIPGCSSRINCCGNK